jgi:hypothetical protein
VACEVLRDFVNGLITHLEEVFEVSLLLGTFLPLLIAAGIAHRQRRPQ